jgi:uncharacterized protein (TIGR02757 family)
VVGLIASSLAFGQVPQILRSVDAVLERMPSPAAWLAQAGDRRLERTFAGFRHRYVTGADLARMLRGARRVLERWGSLGACFRASLDPGDADAMPALERFVAALRGPGAGRNYLVPSPGDGSACKRLNLYLRWMVRRDDVDPGGWDAPPSKLLVPLDTHMHRIARALGLTRRNAADLRTAREVTAGFRRMCPDDPVRYDFALTRLGIRTDTDLEGFLQDCREARRTWQVDPQGAGFRK